MYQEDINATPPRIPPQFLEEGIEMAYGDWQDIRYAERHAQYPHGATPEQIRAARKQAADMMIRTIIVGYKRRQAAAAKTPAQEAKEARDAIRSRYTY